MNITANSVAVQWVVPYLAYGQEQYNMSYGTARGSLSQSRLVSGNEVDVSALNITYNTSLEDLAPNTAYYIQIRSTNAIGDTLSETLEFTTLEAGKTNKY